MVLLDFPVQLLVALYAVNLVSGKNPFSSVCVFLSFRMRLMILITSDWVGVGLLVFCVLPIEIGIMLFFEFIVAYPSSIWGNSSVVLWIDYVTDDLRFKSRYANEYINGKRSFHD
jgi:hypothetical protein